MRYLPAKTRLSGQIKFQGQDILSLSPRELRRLRGNRWVAAQWLGLNRATVRKKLGLYGLADVDGEEDEPAG